MSTTTTDRIDVTLDRIAIASRKRIAAIVTNQTSRTIRQLSAAFVYRIGHRSGGVLVFWESHGAHEIDLAPGQTAKFVTLHADAELQSLAASLSADEYFVQLDHCRGGKRQELLRIPGAIVGEFLASIDAN